MTTEEQLRLSQRRGQAHYLWFDEQPVPQTGWFSARRLVHRDYSVRGSRIRLSMFSDRLEIQSPGAPPHTLNVESMAVRQATRNQAIASRMGVGEIPGSAHRPRE